MDKKVINMDSAVSKALFNVLIFQMSTKNNPYNIKIITKLIIKYFQILIEIIT
jgi:hypothetical protein